MSLNIKTTTKMEDEVEFVASSIAKQLKLNKHVLLLVTGGSSIPVCVKVCEFLKKYSPDKTQNVTITLTDERYGPVGHADSNWKKLIEQGLDLPGAKLIPVLSGDSHDVTIEKFNKILNEEFKNAQYKIGMFGIGVDGHTAGVLPGTIAVDSKDFVSGYFTPAFSRVTMTPFAIKELDEAVVWLQGPEKWQVLKDLEKDIELIKQPAQILKKVPLLTIFTDYK